MAKEALKVEETEELEELEVPTGGIGDFVMDDDELEAAYGDDSETDAKEEFGDNGIAQFPALAERMAKYGRNEDNMLAHVAEGELVIPAQFLEDEVMKQRIYDILTEAGVEDPEAYVVGAEANDLNPTTGLPEFFLKKLFKKIGKAIKKVVKAVVKVVKKVAPIILPIAMPFLLPALGPMYGAALGSGIGTLIGGGSIKDALKSALVAGAIGGVTAGFGKGDGTFFQKVGDAAANPGARFSQAFGNVSEGIQSGSFQGFKDAIGKDFVAATDVASSAGEMASQTIKSGDTLSQIAQSNNTTVDALMAANPNITDPNMIIAGESIKIPQVSVGGTAQTGTKLLDTVVDTGVETATELTQPPGFYESVKGALTPGDDIGFGEGMKNAFFPGSTSTTDVLNAQGINPVNASAEQLAGAKLVAADLTPSLLRRYAPAALATTAVAGGAGFFDVPEMEQANFLDYNPDGSPVTGRDLIDADPGKYLVKNLGQIQLNEETGEYEPVANETAFAEEDLVGYAPPEQVAALPPQMGPQNYLMSSTPGGPFARPYVTQGYQAAAEGGPIFPRRTGGIAPTEGTPGEDSVRAMLMPGEFVMTTDAVRGLGNGNLNNGIQNMYSVMRNLESRGRATA
jgi:LysM repeat protein